MEGKYSIELLVPAFRSGAQQMKQFDANRGSTTVELDNGSVVRGVIAGRLMKHRIRVVTGDRVEIEMTPYDLTKGRIIWRSK